MIDPYLLIVLLATGLVGALIWAGWAQDKLGEWRADAREKEQRVVEWQRRAGEAEQDAREESRKNYDLTTKAADLERQLRPDVQLHELSGFTYRALWGDQGLLSDHEISRAVLDEGGNIDEEHYGIVRQRLETLLEHVSRVVDRSLSNLIESDVEGRVVNALVSPSMPVDGRYRIVDMPDEYRVRIDRANVAASYERAALAFVRIKTARGLRQRIEEAIGRLDQERNAVLSRKAGEQALAGRGRRKS